MPNPKAKRIEFRCPDPSANPYLAFSALLLAGLDGIKNKIEPPAPIDKDIYELPPDEMAEIDQVPTSLERGARLARGATTTSCTEGGVFTPDLIETWIDYKRDAGDPAGAAAPAPARVRALLRHLDAAPPLTCGGASHHPLQSARGPQQPKHEPPSNASMAARVLSSESGQGWP